MPDDMLKIFHSCISHNRRSIYIACCNVYNIIVDYNIIRQIFYVPYLYFKSISIG